MRQTLYLAGRYLAYHRLKTAILVASITLIFYLPVGLRVLVDQSATQLTARAEATPLVLGAKGYLYESIFPEIAIFIQERLTKWIFLAIDCLSRQQERKQALCKEQGPVSFFQFDIPLVGL